MKEMHGEIRETRMRLQDLNWMDVESYLQQDNRIILVTGATEQHAYLSLLTDVLIPASLALALSERLNVLVAPPLNFGVSPHFSMFPGTISLSQATFEAVLMDVVESLLHQGFGRFFVLNGHGGNRVPQRLTDLQIEGALRCDWFNWWRSDAVRDFETQYGLRRDHANWGENFPFCRVAEIPQGAKPPVNLGYAEAGQDMRELLGDGSFGGPYQLDDSRMQVLFHDVLDEATLRLAAL